MRILHVTESRSWSGGTVQLWRLCQALLRQGHPARLVCPPDSELLRHTAGSGVEVTLCPMRQDYDLAAAFRIADAVKRFQPDIVHAHHPRAHALCLAAGFFTPMPRLVVSRRVSFHLKKWNIFSQWKYRSSRIRMFIAVSEDIKNVLVAGGVPRDRVRVVHSGVDTGVFSPKPPNEKLRGELGLPADRFLVGSLTHFSWWKGQTFFLEAARDVLATGARAHFLLVGKDTDGPEARKKVDELGIGGRVTLAGFRRDVPEILSLLQASVLSSLAGEGFSGVLRESMAMKVPVVSTDVGGNRELVLDGETGLLVRPGNAQALAQAIRRLMDDPGLAARLAAAAQAKVVNNYSLEKMVEKTMDVYRELLTTR